MLMRVIRLIKRPFVGDQTTGRLAVQQYNGYAQAGVYGGAGQHTLRHMRATNPGGITPGPTHKLTDPSVTGNIAYSLDLQPLSRPIAEHDMPRGNL